MLRLFLVLLISQTVLSRNAGGFPLNLFESHCKQAAVVEGTTTKKNVDSAGVSVRTTLQLQLQLRETVCFRTEIPQDKIDEMPENTFNRTALYTMRFSALEQQHPIKRRYQFGIPQISTTCVCDCPGGERHCDVDSYKHRNCTSSNGLCYRTYRPHQSPIGCFSGEESKLCCEIGIVPYKNWRFWALQLTQPTTVAVFDYRLYEKMSDEQWRTVTVDTIRVSLDEGIQQFRPDDRTDISVSVWGGKPHRQLQNGVYFVQNSEKTLRWGAPLNGFFESDLEKLGWFRRKTNGQWTIRNGLPKLTSAQHVTVSNCKAQQYDNTFTAEQLVTIGDTGPVENINLGKTVESTEHWLSSAQVENGANSRTAMISLIDAMTLTMTMTVENRPRVHFYEHSSILIGFNCSISLDRQSSRFLNISFHGAKGTLIGSVQRNERRRHVEVAFSTSLGTDAPSEHNSILSLPSLVNGNRFVCFHPSGRADRELCQWCTFKADPLDWFQVPHRWQSNTNKECSGCNQVAISSFVHYLDPNQWLDGIGSTSETLAFIFELVVYAVVLLMIIAVVRKCLWPLFKWTLCTSSAPKKV